MNTKEPIKISRETLLEIHDTVCQLEQHICMVNETGKKIARRTLVIIRTVLFLQVGAMILTFALLYHFTGKMEAVVASMIDMYNRFDVMSTDMAAMTASVTHMNTNISGIPTISKSMEGIDAHVVNMRYDVQNMTRNIVHMDDNMVVISGGVQQMADRFDHVTHTVHGMRYNVNQMSGPVRSMPFPFP